MIPSLTVPTINGGQKTVQVAGPSGAERILYTSLPNGWYPASMFPTWADSLRPGGNQDYGYFAYSAVTDSIRKGRWHTSDPRENERDHNAEAVTETAVKMVTDPKGAVETATNAYGGITPLIKNVGLYAVLFAMLLLGILGLLLPVVKSGTSAVTDLATSAGMSKPKKGRTKTK